MIHLGDITKISGYTAPIVDVVVGGVLAKTYLLQAKEQVLMVRGRDSLWNS